MGWSNSCLIQKMYSVYCHKKGIFHTKGNYWGKVAFLLKKNSFALDQALKVEKLICVYHENVTTCMFILNVTDHSTGDSGHRWVNGSSPVSLELGHQEVSYPLPLGK